MGIKAKENFIWAWAFLTGVVLALLIGLSTSLISIPFLKVYNAQVYGLLVLLMLKIGVEIQSRRLY